MNLQEAKEYFKSYNAMARVLQVTPQAIQHWRKAGYIPYLHQLNLERLTEGALMADEQNVNSKFYKYRIIKQQQKGE